MPFCLINVEGGTILIVVWKMNTIPTLEKGGINISNCSYYMNSREESQDIQYLDIGCNNHTIESKTTSSENLEDNF